MAFLMRLVQLSMRSCWIQCDRDRKSDESGKDCQMKTQNRSSISGTDKVSRIGLPDGCSKASCGSGLDQYYRRYQISMSHCP